MMFDPPDFPYRELSETLREHFSAEDLFNNDISNTEASSTGDALIEPNQNATNIDSQLKLHSNNSGRDFNIESASYGDVNAGNSQPNTELYVVQPDMFNFVPTLLDDNIVNQFLLPLHVTEKDKEVENGPDLLALHSCAVCHEIFTTEADLLDHTISFHASDNTDRGHNNVINIDGDSINETNNQNFEADWFVCGICERVLSAASEGELNDQLNSKNLCCIDENGKVITITRKLSAMYVCDYCSYLFADGEALDRHRLTCCSDKGQYDAQPMEPLGTDISSTDITEILDSCNISKDNSTIDSCSTNVAYQTKVQRRQTRRSCSSTGNSKMWNCGSCNQLFATARELYRHKRGEDRPAGAPLMAYVCEECDKVLGSMCALHTHKKMHKVSKPGYPCRVCGRRFNQSGHLAIHMRMHTGERPYPCDLCPKAFKVKVERDDHRRTHTGERPFACTACPKTFTAAARLREHARIHTDQRPYRCEICGAAFRRPYARTVHTLIHSGAKPHKCDVCGTAFRRSGDMWKHKRTLHGIPTSNAL